MSPVGRVQPGGTGLPPPVGLLSPGGRCQSQRRIPAGTADVLGVRRAGGQWLESGEHRRRTGFSYSDKRYWCSPVLLTPLLWVFQDDPYTPPPEVRKVGPSRLFAEPMEDGEMEQVELPGEHVRLLCLLLLTSSQSQPGSLVEMLHWKAMASKQPRLEVPEDRDSHPPHIVPGRMLC